jgi:hypothetical protein
MAGDEAVGFGATAGMAGDEAVGFGATTGTGPEAVAGGAGCDAGCGAGAGAAVGKFSFTGASIISPRQTDSIAFCISAQD